jgi:hypothetical protein
MRFMIQRASNCSKCAQEFEMLCRSMSRVLQPDALTLMNVASGGNTFFQAGVCFIN